MKTYTIEQLEDCIYDNKSRKEIHSLRNKPKKVNVISFNQIDDKYIIIETNKSDSDWFTFMTCDMDYNNTISKISYNRDVQILITLWLKYEWNNSQFSSYASRMLNINY